MRVGIVHSRRTVCGPAGVRNAGAAVQMIGFNLRHQFGHTRRAAGAL